LIDQSLLSPQPRGAASMGADVGKRAIRIRECRDGDS
jgi:hypothetical protein